MTAVTTHTVLELLRQATQSIERVLIVRLASLTPRQATVLAHVDNLGNSPSQSALVEATGIDRSTLADIVRRLVARGLLERKRLKSDARTYAVSLTAEGRKALIAARLMQIDVESDMLSKVKAAQRAAMLKGLESLIHVEVTQ